MQHSGSALQTFAALMFSGFLFSLSVETDPPGLNVLSHATRATDRHAVQGLHFANIQSTVVIGIPLILRHWSLEKRCVLKVKYWLRKSRYALFLNVHYISAKYRLLVIANETVFRRSHVNKFSKGFYKNKVYRKIKFFRRHLYHSQNKCIIAKVYIAINF